MSSIALFFGSYNPVHRGHLLIANYALHFCEVEEVWLVASPWHPHKPLLANELRIKLLELSTAQNPRLHIPRQQFALKENSNNTDILEAIKAGNPSREFCILMGFDNLLQLNRWRAIATVLSEHRILVFPRPTSQPDLGYQHPNIEILRPPIYLDISSTFIRNSIAQGIDVGFLLHDDAYAYIQRNSLYSLRGPEDAL